MEDWKIGKIGVGYGGSEDWGGLEDRKIGEDWGGSGVLGGPEDWGGIEKDRAYWEYLGGSED